MSATQPVGQRVRQEQVGQQGAEVVDARDKPLLRRRWVVKCCFPAWVDEDGGQDADVVAPDGGADSEVEAEYI